MRSRPLPPLALPCPAGKRDLPAPLRNRFTEIWVGEPPQVRCAVLHVGVHLLSGVWE